MNKYILIFAALLTVISLSIGDVVAESHSATRSYKVQKHKSRDSHKNKKDQFNRGDRKEPLLKMLSEELNLTEEQELKITDLLKSEREKFREEERAKREENHSTIIGKIKSDVLTPEQSAKLDELETKRESGELLKARINNRLDRLIENLQLTSEQKEKLTDLFEKHRPDREIRRDEENHHVRMDREKRDEFREELAQILTHEQLKKFEEIRKDKMKDRSEKKAVNKRKKN